MQEDIRRSVFARCQQALPGWRQTNIDEFEFDDPKGFSSFTVGVRGHAGLQPPAVLFRQLEGKDNAILDYAAERDVFLTLAENEVAAQCYHYERDYRIEQFYSGRTLTAGDLDKPDIIRRIAEQLYKLHQVKPECLPEDSFFQLLHDKWGPLARHVLEEQIDRFPANEQEMCQELRSITTPETAARTSAKSRMTTPSSAKEVASGGIDPGVRPPISA